MTADPYTDEDVSHFATFITGHPDADVAGPPVAATRAVLAALADEGRLAPLSTDDVVIVPRAALAALLNVYDVWAVIAEPGTDAHAGMEPACVVVDQYETALRGALL